MKRICILLLICGYCHVASAQFSFKELTATLRAGEDREKVDISHIVLGERLTSNILMDTILRRIEVADSLYKQKRLTVLKGTGTVLEKEKKIAELNKERDSVTGQQRYLYSRVKYWKKYYKYKDRKFFPAYYSSHSMDFFEGDSLHQRLFQNNAVNYNPQSRKMTLYTEAVNDYLGPLRVGIGFQVKSDVTVDSLSTVDSTQKLEKKTDMLSDLQNGGGDISINVRLPLFKNRDTGALIQAKFYFYGNTGFSLPVLSKATEDFIFNYDFGIEGAVYMRGFNKRLTFFSQIKAGYFAGNDNYQQVIRDANQNDAVSFFMLQTSFGFDFMDSYRFRVDLFNGNSFVKKNFPATVTFVVRPGKSDKK